MIVVLIEEERWKHGH